MEEMMTMPSLLLHLQLYYAGHKKDETGNHGGTREGKTVGEA